MTPPSGGDEAGDEEQPQAPELAGRRIVVWPTFEREVERLEGKYPHIADDLREGLASPTTRCDAVPGYANKLFKLRVRSRDMRRGSRGGFRVYVWRELGARPAPPAQPTTVSATFYLVTVYPKSEREDLTREQMRLLLSRFLDWVSDLSVPKRR